MTSDAVAVVGLGRMGAAMARRLSQQGFDVLGVDPNPEAGRGLPNAVRKLDRVRDVPAETRWTILSLPSSREVEAVLEGPDGLFGHLGATSCVIDTSSSDPHSTRRLARAAREVRLNFIDAPVSGGPKGAEEGQLAISVGGDMSDLEAARPPLDALAKRVVHVGESGAGHVTKVVNNLLCAAHLLLDGAGVRLAKEQGVDPERLIEAINGGSGRSAVTEAFMPNWILPETFDSGFTMALMCKDLRLAAPMLDGRLGEQELATVTEVWKRERERLGDDADFTRMAALSINTVTSE